MALPQDIVAVFYSGSVNAGASQSSASNIAAIIPVVNTDKRLWQKFDNIYIIPGLTEFVGISEHLIINVTHAIGILYTRSISETVTISESLSSKSKHIRVLIEGFCSILFNGLSAP